MISIDADKALRPARPPEEGHLYLLRDSARDRDNQSSKEGQTSNTSNTSNNSNNSNNGVGSIQVIRPLNEVASNPTNTSGAMMYDDGLSAARGMLLGIALGIGFWSLAGGLVGMFLF